MYDGYSIDILYHRTLLTRHIAKLTVWISHSGLWRLFLLLKFIVFLSSLLPKSPSRICCMFDNNFHPAIKEVMRMNQQTIPSTDNSSSNSPQPKMELPGGAAPLSQNLELLEASLMSSAVDDNYWLFLLRNPNYVNEHRLGLSEAVPFFASAR